jgi:hypothetical protein
MITNGNLLMFVNYIHGFAYMMQCARRRRTSIAMQVLYYNTAINCQYVRISYIAFTITEL